MSKLPDFISERRARFIIEDDNIFAFSWAKVSQRVAFLDIIQQRHDAASAAFIANSEAMRKASPPGFGLVSPELAAISDEGRRLNSDLRLQIESYYLFAKI